MELAQPLDDPSTRLRHDAHRPQDDEEDEDRKDQEDDGHGYSATPVAPSGATINVAPLTW